MSAHPSRQWVPAPSGVTCPACESATVVTSRRARPVTRCTSCGLIVLGAYDARLDLTGEWSPTNGQPAPVIALSSAIPGGRGE
jgi:hypothetical protein